jgi:hypothetical protein
LVGGLGAATPTALRSRSSTELSARSSDRPATTLPASGGYDTSRAAASNAIVLSGARIGGAGFEPATSGL